MTNSDEKPLIIAHRGASALAPENTLAAFQKAIEDEAEGIEFDVRPAKDGVPVVFHDATLKRIAGRDERVIDLSSAELAGFDAGSWFNEKKPKKAASAFSSENIPTLRRALDFLSGYKGILYIELKSRKGEIETLVEAVCREIRDTPLFENIILKSFRLEAVPKIRQICPAARTAALFAPKIMTMLRKEKHLVKIARDLGAHQLSLHYSLLTAGLMKKAAGKNLPVAVWTVDNPLWVKRALKLGVRAVITNDPGRLLAKRRQVLHKNSILA